MGRPTDEGLLLETLALLDISTRFFDEIIAVGSKMLQ